MLFFRWLISLSEAYSFLAEDLKYANVPPKNVRTDRAPVAIPSITVISFMMFLGVEKLTPKGQAQ